MSLPRAIYRAVCLLATVIAFLGVGMVLSLFYAGDAVERRRQVARYTRRWARCFCHFLNIQARVVGERKIPGNALIVANHVGSPDIFVIGSRFETFFVSKSDIRSWPLTGRLASLGATIFVDRGRRQQVGRTVAEIRERLENGFDVAIFPEGGATDGADVAPFKTSHFEAAILAQRPVLPLMIRYLDGRTPSVACWRDVGFASHLVALLKNPRLDAEIHILPEISGNADRRELAAASRRLIREAHRRANAFSS
jgi:1-acyl-sn-glycerol-3-phosphate acyltransferase